MSKTEDLLSRCRDTTYTDEKPIAADLNHLLGRVQWTLESSTSDGEALECDIEFAEAALRIVERVADFEHIGVKDQP